jgi:hypothetical protein
MVCFVVWSSKQFVARELYNGHIICFIHVLAQVHKLNVHGYFNSYER